MEKKLLQSEAFVAEDNDTDERLSDGGGYALKGECLDWLGEQGFGPGLLGLYKT